MLVFWFNPQNKIPKVFWEFNAVIFFWGLGLGFLRGRGSIFWLVGGRGQRRKEDATTLNGFFKGGVEEVEDRT